jgi:hypothetical protein
VAGRDNEFIKRDRTAERQEDLAKNPGAAAKKRWISLLPDPPSSVPQPRLTTERFFFPTYEFEISPETFPIYIQLRRVQQRTKPCWSNCDPPIWTLFIVALAHLLDDPETYRRTCSDGNSEKRFRLVKNACGAS